MSENEVTNVRIEVVIQGAPVVNHASLHFRGDNIAAIAIDLRSKYCEISGAGGMDNLPTLGIAASERSLLLDESQPRDTETELAFPEFEGWQIWSAECSRYTAKVCLVRQEAADAP